MTKTLPSIFGLHKI